MGIFICGESLLPQLLITAEQIVIRTVCHCSQTACVKHVNTNTNWENLVLLYFTSILYIKVKFCL